MELQMSSRSSTAQVFQDFQINVKLKISALWIAIMFCYVYGDYIEIYVPGVIADAMTVKSSIETQLEFFAVALLMAMPSVMIFFTSG
jgi:nitrous oxidase accessory protein NosD